MNKVLAEVTGFLDEELHTTEIADYPNALNGLQLENSGTVSRVALAVDASEQAIARAVAMEADLLVVHHGLFWSGLRPVTGALRRKMYMAMTGNLAVYSSHLPLDMHPLHGNNARLAFLSGMECVGEGFPHHGGRLGMECRFSGSLYELIARLRLETGHTVHAYLSDNPHDAPGRIMVCSGGAGDEIAAVAEMGIRTYITGEGSHWTIPAAAEYGVNLILAGHYETETFGVKALGSLLHNRFGLPSAFIDLPPAAYSSVDV